MSSLTQTIGEHSEAFLPRFARVTRAASGRTMHYPPLDFDYDEHGPLPTENETLLGRWVGMGAAIFTSDEAGRPFVPGTRTGVTRQLFQGGYDLALTERRLLIYLLVGETIVGNVSPRQGPTLLAVLPLAAIESLSVDKKSGLFSASRTSAYR